ncbi:MAG: iron-sulfur cluster assembly scaffold protein [Gammaproteobacteria bacterium]
MPAYSENPSGYSEKVWSRFRHPAHAGQLEQENQQVVTGSSRDPATGEVVQIWLHVEDGRIIAARFKALGSPVTIAAASLAAEKLEGMPIDATQQLSGRTLVKALSAPVEKTSCGLLVEDAIRAALKSVAAAQS